VRKGGWYVGLTTLPPSYADCLEIWDPQSPGTCRACPRLQWDCFNFYFYIITVKISLCTHNIARMYDMLCMYVYMYVCTTRSKKFQSTMLLLIPSHAPLSKTLAIDASCVPCTKNMKTGSNKDVVYTRVCRSVY